MIWKIFDKKKYIDLAINLQTVKPFHKRWKYTYDSRKEWI